MPLEPLHTAALTAWKNIIVFAAVLALFYGVTLFLINRKKSF